VTQRSTTDGGVPSVNWVRVTEPPDRDDAATAAAWQAADVAGPQAVVARSGVITNDAGGVARSARGRRGATTRTDTLNDALPPSPEAGIAQRTRSRTEATRHVAMRPH